MLTAKVLQYQQKPQDQTGCRDKCTSNFTDEDRDDILKTVHNDKLKNEQDVYLMGLIERSDVKRVSAKEDSSKKKSSSFPYFAMKNT